MQKVINLPFELLTRCKRNDVSLEMLVCALLIKARFQNSVLFLKVTNVMDALGISHKKARKVINHMKESELFIFNKEKNCVFAKSFKSKVMMIYGRKNNKKFESYADGCRKVKVSTDDTLRTMKRKFRDYLLIRALHANEHDHFNVGVNLDVTKQNIERAMTHRKLGAVIGMSKSSGRRFTQRLIEENRVSKSEIVAERVIDHLNENTEADWYRNHPKKKFAAWHNPYGGWSGWIVYGFVYSIMSYEDLDAMKHVIWNHKNRIHNNDSNGDESCSGYYDKM